MIIRKTSCSLCKHHLKCNTLKHTLLSKGWCYKCFIAISRCTQTLSDLKCWPFLQSHGERSIA